MVSQLSWPYSATRSLNVSTTGPPFVPSGSIDADMPISRFGSVGPSTEQK
jgi:hypothetical protein